MERQIKTICESGDWEVEARGRLIDISSEGNTICLSWRQLDAILAEIEMMRPLVFVEDASK